MALTSWQWKQKRARLLREIDHFSARLTLLQNPATPQDKRNRTRAERCLAERRRLLQRLEA